MREIVVVAGVRRRGGHELHRARVDAVEPARVAFEDAERARRALIDAGFTIDDERRVVITPIENRPGAAGALLRRVADMGVNIDLLYMTADGRLVLGGADVDGLRRALGEGAGTSPA
jgi:hypothetical protein